MTLANNFIAPTNIRKQNKKLKNIHIKVKSLNLLLEANTMLIPSKSEQLYPVSNYSILDEKKTHLNKEYKQMNI